MERARKVLAAFSPQAIPMLERILGGSVAFLPVHSLPEAKAALQYDAGISLVACGVHFDESRMFELLRYARGAFPRLPFVCCRMLSSELSRISLEAIAISAASLGAETFFDLPGRAKEVGEDAAERELRGILLRYLQDAGAARAD